MDKPFLSGVDKMGKQILINVDAMVDLTGDTYNTYIHRSNGSYIHLFEPFEYIKSLLIDLD